MTVGIYFQITGVCMLAAKPMQLIDLWEDQDHNCVGLVVVSRMEGLDPKREI